MPSPSKSKTLEPVLRELASSLACAHLSVPSGSKTAYAYAPAAAISGSWSSSKFAIVGGPSQHLADAFEKLIPQDDTGIAEKFVRYMRTTLGEWFGLAEKRAHLMRAWAGFFRGYDLLVCPAVPVVAFPHMAEGSGVHSDQLFRRITIDGEPAPYLDFAWQGLALIANLPATVMPTGKFSDGLPTGLQIIGPHFGEAKLLNVAHRYQQETQWHREIPENYK